MKILCWTFSLEQQFQTVIHKKKKEKFDGCPTRKVPMAKKYGDLQVKQST